MNQNEKTRIRRHFRLCLSLVSNGKGTNLHIDGSIKKKKKATFHSTMLYTLSCGELAMNGEHILRLYMTSRVYMWCKEQVSKESKEQAFWFLSNMTKKNLFKSTNVQMHVLNLRVREEGNLIHEWKQKRWIMNQNQKIRIRRHFRQCISLV